MKLVLALIGIFSLISCASKPVYVTTPSGKDGIVISCGAISKCYKQATKLCKGPYTIVDKNEKTSVDVDKYGASSSSRTTYLIECSNPVAASPKTP